jgi:hypothetical protein
MAAAVKRGGRGAAKARLAPRLSPWQRWVAVGVIVSVLVFGIPILHALLGDIVALLVLTFAGGFALGRATGRRA